MFYLKELAWPCTTKSFNPLRDQEEAESHSRYPDQARHLNNGRIWFLLILARWLLAKAALLSQTTCGVIRTL